MRADPKVSIVLTCYNQAQFIVACLEAISILDYKNIELILVDNGSADNSVNTIKQWLALHQFDFPSKLIFHTESKPYCKCFNEAFQYVNGKYFIDLAADDFLKPGHITSAVSKFLSNRQAGAVFSDADLVNENGDARSFYKRDKNGDLVHRPTDGDIFCQLVAKNHLLSATCIFRTESFRELGGYDEALSYEDFDFLTRLARSYTFVFSDHIGIQKSLHRHSFSASQYKSRNSIMLPSTYSVCKKIQAMVKNEEEKEALRARVRYELRHALASANFEVAKDFVTLGKEIEVSGVEFYLQKIWSRMRWDLSDLIYGTIRNFSLNR